MCIASGVAALLMVGTDPYDTTSPTAIAAPALAAPPRWLGWLKLWPIPLLLLLLLALLTLLTVLAVAAGHILGPPGLLLYWIGVWGVGVVWFRNF